MIPSPADSVPAAQFPVVTQRPEGPAWQFRISSLLWWTLTAAITLAYARQFGQGAMMLVLVMPLVAAVIGAGLGSFTRRMQSAIYWAVVGATLGAVCVVAAPQEPRALLFWPILGAVAGGYAGASQPRRTIPALVTAAALGGLLGAAFYWPLAPRASTFSVDLAIAPLVAAVLAALVRLVDWLQARRRLSREVWATSLVFAVIAGNLWSASFTGRLQ